MANWKGGDTSYLQNIQNACHQHPSLKLLKSLPIATEHLSRVKVLEFSENSTVNNVDIYKLPQLDAYWSSTSSSGCKGRLYLVEDISLPWISALGIHFNLDPRFFAEYLKLDLDRTQHLLSGYHTMRRLPSLRPTTNFATFVYHEIRTFDGNAPRREDYEILTHDNVARLVTTVDHHCGRATGLIRRNMGVWWHSPSAEGDAWDAIILVDPSVSSTFNLRRWTAEDTASWHTTTCTTTPYLDGYPDFSPWPPVNVSTVGSSGHSSSGSSTAVCNSTSSSTAIYNTATTPNPSYTIPFETPSLLTALASHWHTTPSSLHPSTDPRDALLIAHRILASHWNLQLEYLVSVVSTLEKGLLAFEQLPAHPRAETLDAEVVALRTLLSDVNAWRRRVFFYEEQMKWNAEGVCMDEGVGESGGAYVCSGDDARRREGQNTCGSTAALAATDFAPVRASLHLTRLRIASLLPVVMGAFSLLEAQHSVVKADLTLRLSSVVLIFVPLSFTASLFSMSVPFLPGQRLFWVYWVVSIPIIVALFWYAFWVQMGRAKRVGVRKWARKWRAEVGEGEEMSV